MRNKTAIFITLALFTLLFACSGEKTPHERLAGIWDVDDKASWEYQKPGEAYVSGIAELQRDISIQFDIQEQTCRALNAFGNHLLRYRVVAEEKDKITLLIGENTFIFEFKADDRLLLCSPNSGVGNCLILARGKASEEAERQRMTEAESRLAAIVKMHTQNVASRIEQFLIRALFDSGVRVTDADMFQLYVAESNALEGGKPKNEGQPPEDAVELLNSMLRDFVANNNLQYARIYTRNGTVCLSSEMNAPQPSAMQRVYILNAAKTGEPGPITLIGSGSEHLFELYLPILKPVGNSEKEVVGVLAVARLMFPLPEKCFTPDMPIPDGNLYFIRDTGQNYEIIGGTGVKGEVQVLELTDAGEMPFARRNSLEGEGEVCSQASHGPVANSWVLFETSCISPFEK